jgi:hypothetical protein
MLRSKALRQLLKRIDIPTVFNIDFEGRTNANVFCPFHEDPNVSTSKSCSVSADGLFHCKGCQKSGDIFDFYAAQKSLTREQAIEELNTIPEPQTKTAKKRGRKPARPLEPVMVQECQKRLTFRDDFRTYLFMHRGLSENTLEGYNIGCDEYRITIPIFNAESMLINLRRYGPGLSPKMLSFSTGYGAPALYPLPQYLSTPIEEPVFLCEGEWDCLLLRQLGFNAITVTGSVKAWDDEFNKHFQGRTVYIIHDVNDKEQDGAFGAVKRAHALKDYATEIKVITLDLPDTYVGGDVTDYFIKENHAVEDFETLIAKAQDPAKLQKFLVPVAGLSSVNAEDIPFIPLDEASHSKYYYKPIKVRCLVAGKGAAPFLPPKKIKITFLDDQGQATTITHEFDPWEKAILSLIQCTTTKLYQFFRSFFSIPLRATMSVEILSTFNIEEVFLIPAIDFSMAQGVYVIRRCFYIGHDIQSNRVYDFLGYTLAAPSNQTATHIFTTAIPAETDIDTFSMDEFEVQELKETFQTEEPYEKLLNISGQLSEHITKIYGRPELHIAVDLVFHSPLLFSFDGTQLKKGWLEVLILGDTRTGKGFVTEGLAKHYKAGEVVSGENLTLAGLIGGVQHLGDKWTLVWGKVPLADRRLVVLDEAGALSPQDISRLSRIRSEGVAEITKIVSEKTTSRTRLIWLANPRPRTPDQKCMLSDYNYGIDAVPELIGAPEDIARFDFVLIVAHSDVSSDVINKTHKVTTELKYTSQLCHNLVMWVWSRKPDQIYFERGIERYTMKVAKELASHFVSKIPLVQAEDIRFKLARIAAAVAGRTFSTPDGVHLVIKKAHVEFAYNFLHNIYSKTVCGYAQLSTVEHERQTLKSPEEVLAVLQEAGTNFTSLVDGLLEHRQLSVRDLCDYSGLDIYEGRSIVSELVRLRALIKEHSYYVKKPAFRAFLRKLCNK